MCTIKTSDGRRFICVSARWADTGDRIRVAKEIGHRVEESFSGENKGHQEFLAEKLFRKEYVLGRRD